MTRVYRMQDIKIEKCMCCHVYHMYMPFPPETVSWCGKYEKIIPDPETIPDFCKLETLEEYQWKEDLKIRIDSVLNDMELEETEIEMELIGFRNGPKTVGGLSDEAELNGKLFSIRQTIKLLKKVIHGDE